MLRSVMLFTGKKIWIYLARLNPEFDHNLDPDKIEIGFFYWNLESSIFSRFWILDPDKNWKKILDPVFPDLSGFWIQHFQNCLDSGIQYLFQILDTGSSILETSPCLDPVKDCFPDYWIQNFQSTRFSDLKKIQYKNSGFQNPESGFYWILLDFPIVPICFQMQIKEIVSI